MRDIRFAYRKADGGVAIVQCGDGVMYPGIDDAQAIDLAVTRMKAAGTMPADAVPVPIAVATLPATRKYREAWRLRDGAVVLDDAKKAEIDARAPRLTPQQEIADIKARLGAVERK